MDHRYCECGRKILVYRHKGFKGMKRPNADHILCQRCWKSDKDSQQSTEKKRVATGDV